MIPFVYLQIEELEQKMKEMEGERKKERELFEKEREGFASPGKFGNCLDIVCFIKSVFFF